MADLITFAISFLLICVGIFFIGATVFLIRFFTGD